MAARRRLDEMGGDPFGYDQPYFDQPGAGAATTGGYSAPAPSPQATKTISEGGYMPNAQAGPAGNIPMPQVINDLNTQQQATQPKPYDAASTEDSWLNFIRSLYPSTSFGAQPGGAVNLQDLVDQYNKLTGGSAKVAGSDKIDFGGGAVDVIRGSKGGGTELWFDEKAQGGGFGPSGRYGEGYAGTSGGAGGGAGGGSGSYANRPLYADEIMNSLRGLFPGGMFNQDIVNRRTDSARADIERARKSFGANNAAALAERGLIGSGPEQTAQNSLDERMYDQYLQQSSDIYANESENADQRMMQALQIAAGMTAEEAKNAVDWFRAQNDFTLGQGGLALGNLNAVNDYNLGMANYGLNRDKLGYDLSNQDLQRYIDLIKMWQSGSNQSAGGYVR